MKTHISYNKVFWSFLIIAFLTGSLALAAPVGKISAIQGRVDVLKAGKNVAAPVSLGAPVDIGDIYRTKSKSRAEIIFNNNNTLKIAPATRIEIKEYMVGKERSSTVMKLYRGKVQAAAHEDFVKRAAAFAEGNRFEVHTPNAVAGIRGSDMIVGFTNGATMVVFISGHGYLYNPESPQVFVPIVAGQVSFITGEGTPTAPVKASEAIISGEVGAFIQVIESKKDTKQEEIIITPPPPPPDIPPVSGTNFTGTMLFFGSDGTFTGNIPDTGVGTMSASGTYTDTPPTELEGWLEGTSDKGGAFLGPLAGVQGSWLNRTAALYVEGGQVYFLTGDAPGTLADTAFSMSGTFGKSASQGTVTLTPEPEQTLLQALEYAVNYGDAPQFFPSDTPFIISNSGIEITPTYFDWSVPYLISNEGKKVAAISNMYTGAYASTEGTSLPYLGYAGDNEYALGSLFYTPNTTNSTFKIDMLLQSIGIDEDIGPYLGVYSMRYFGKYEDDIFRMAGAGTYVATPANFFGDWGGDSLYYNESGVFEYAGSDYGYFGGTAAPWTSPASFTAIGSYELYTSDKPHYLMNTYISGSTTQDVSGGLIKGFAGAIWKGGTTTTVGSISDGTLRVLYVSTPVGGYVTAGIMKSDFTGSYYPFSSDSGMWGIGGTLTPTQLASGLNPSYLYDGYGGMSGQLSGTFGSGGSIYGESTSPYTQWLYLDTDPYVSLPFGIFNIVLGNDSNPNYYTSKPEGNPSWSAKLGGAGQFGKNSEDEGYYLATVSGTWTDTGEITGNLTGKALTPVLLYDMEGRFTGVNYSDTWIGQAIGSYTGTPTDFGGNWYNCTLYNDYGYMGWNSEENQGVFGFVKRTDGNYNFLAIGEFYDYGYGGYYAEDFGGGPYIWSGNMSYGGSTAHRGIFAFTSGIWKKANLDDTYGTMAGYTAAAYYTEDGKVGLIKGPLTGNFYDMDYDDYPIYGMWKVQSSGALTTIDKTASLPEGFNVETASVNGGPLYANLAGSFAGSTETGNTIVGGDSWNYSHTMFITYTDASANKSLPFGVYNLKLTGYDDYDYDGNYYYGKPAGTSVTWSAKIGGYGGFGNNSSDEGYWLANIGSTWEKYGVEPESGHEYGTINGTLSGTYITSTHMGTVGGPFYGLYTEDGICPVSGGYGTWVGMSIGTYEGTPLKFSSSFSTDTSGQVKLYRALPGTYYEGGYQQTKVVDGIYYYYDYEFDYVKSNETGMGMGRKDDGYWDKENNYFPDGTRYYKDENGQITRFTFWDIGIIEYVKNLPSDSFWDPSDSTFAPNRYSKWASPIDVLEQRSSDTFAGILGSTGYPWNAGGASITIIGRYHASDSDYTKPTIFTTQLSGKFYSTSVEDGITNGAYEGTMGGFLADDARGVQIGMRGLYIGPDNNTAGVLRGSYTGSLYKDIGMWDATGTLVATVMNDSFLSNPAGVNKDNLDVSGNIVYGAIGSQMMGNFTSGGSPVSGSIFATMVNSGTTRSIKGQDWGVFNSAIWAGGYGVPSSTLYSTWSAKVGAEGQFGEYQDASSNWHFDTGTSLMSINGTFTGGVVRVPYTGTVGTFMTMTKRGTISDVGVLGIYKTETVNPNILYSWQGVMGGVWNTTQDLTFASSFGNSTERFGVHNSGSWSSDASHNYFYYYDTDTNSGDITITWVDGSVTKTTKRRYRPDEGPFSSKTWEEFTYDTTTKVIDEASYQSGTYTTLNDAVFTALAASTPYSYPAVDSSPNSGFNENGSISAIMGGVGDLWTATASSPATVYFLGDYDHWYGKPTIFGTEIMSYNITNDTNTTLDGKGAYYGYIGGREIDSAIEGRIYAVYLNKIDDTTSKAGILKGTIIGTVYSDIEMWAGTGTIYPVKLMDVAVPLASFYTDHIYTRDFNDNTGSNTSFTLNGYPMGAGETPSRPFVYQGEGTTFYAGVNQSWGVWQSAVGGKYTGITPTDSWNATIEFIDSTRIMGNGVMGTKWSGNKVEGTTVGYGADIQPEQTYTWISVGELKGTFNPTLTTFQVGIMGVSVETNTYLTLAATDPGKAKLQALGIPAVQVGMVTLAGSGNNFTTLSMNDVKFFATSAGGKPSIWATNSVTGNYTASPSTSTPISLSGGTLNASFNFKQWNPGSNGKWLGSVSGTGGFNGSTSFSGAAAGTGATSGLGSITGTAAGVAK